ncbi:MAG: glycosyltransferase family 4 protein [Deltaproteobacteria bacterium]
MDPRPRIVCALQLPPPLHGVTAMNAQLVASGALQRQFRLDVVPLQFSATVAELGSVNARKLVRGAVIGTRLARRFARRPAAFYLTLAPQRPAITRDAAFLALARAARIPRIVHLHARPTRDVLPILRRALHGATVILLSPALRSDFGDTLHDAQVHYVPNGLSAAPNVERAARPVPRILFLSHLLPAKGPLVLVEALLELARRGLPFEATFAGSPTRELGLDALRAALAPLGSRVRCVGEVDRSTTTSLFRDHDVLAYPSRADAFPLVLIEALRAGLPIVASEVGACAEIVGNAGLIVPPGDAPRLADALAQLLVAPSLRSELGAVARARFSAHYTVERWESALAAAINAALSTR